MWVQVTRGKWGKSFRRNASKARLTLSWGQNNLPHWMLIGVKGISCTLSHYNTVHAWVANGLRVWTLYVERSNRSTSQKPLRLMPGYQNVYRYQPTVLSPFEMALQQTSACTSLYHTYTLTLSTHLTFISRLAHQGSWAHCSFWRGLVNFSSFVVLHDWSRRPITFSNSHVATTNSLS